MGPGGCALAHSLLPLLCQHVWTSPRYCHQCTCEPRHCCSAPASAGIQYMCAYGCHYPTSSGVCTPSHTTVTTSICKQTPPHQCYWSEHMYVVSTTSLLPAYMHLSMDPAATTPMKCFCQIIVASGVGTPQPLQHSRCLTSRGHRIKL